MDDESRLDSNSEFIDTTHQQFDEHIRVLLPGFEIFPEIRKAILFGSRARGDFEERSDIDLAIDVPDADILKLDEIAQYIGDNSNTLLPIDLIWIQESNEKLLKQIERDGVVLYERKDESIHRESSSGTCEAKTCN